MAEHAYCSLRRARSRGRGIVILPMMFLLMLAGWGCGGRSQEDKPRARQHYNQGRAYYEEGDYGQAIEEFDRALELWPGFADACSARAEVQMLKEDVGPLTALLRSLKPGRLSAVDTDSVLASLDILERLPKGLESNPAAAAQMLYYRGNKRFKAGDYAGALKDYAKAVEINPGYALAWDNMGAVYGRLGDHDRAIENHTKAIELDPDLVNAYLNRGSSYGLQKDFDRALEDFTKVIDLSEENGRAYGSRAYIYSDTPKRAHMRRHSPTTLRP